MISYKLVAIAVGGLVLVSSIIMNWSQHKNMRLLEGALETADEHIESLVGEIDGLKLEMERQANILVDREAKISKLSRDKYQLSKQLQEAVEHDTNVKAWANQHIPTAVSGMLRNSAADSDTAAIDDAVQ